MAENAFMTINTTIKQNLALRADNKFEHSKTFVQFLWNPVKKNARVLEDFHFSKSVEF